MDKKLHEYILDNWKNTIRENKDILPKPYTVPCTKEVFINFYYWDTYFINLGLFRAGLIEQVKNNLDNMVYLLDKYGYIPNADHLLYRSQPPLFTRCVYDLYKFTNDKKVIFKYKDAILKEFTFWKEKRMTPIGLNAYSSDEPKDGLLNARYWLGKRIGCNETEMAVDEVLFGRDLLAIAESGMDFTIRFKEGDNRFAAHEFAHLDLNCLLFDAEMKASEMFEDIGDKNTASSLRKQAKDRKDLIDKYMLDKETGIYYDYNFVKDHLSYIKTGVCLYPYFSGVSNNKKAAKELYKAFMLPYGLSVGVARKEEDYLQWDYPHMWPANTYLAYIGYRRIGLDYEADNIKEKYMTALEVNFKATGSLWEKYDASSGKISVTNEYETPEMMGWVAGVYEFFYKEQI